MTKPYLEVDLAKFGPAAPPSAALSLEEARAYCRRLAQEHYENFSVTHCLLPRELRQHFCNIYSYCRWADDLADEIASPEESLALLDWWRGEVEELFSSPARRASEGNASILAHRDSLRHPVFIALADTAGEFDIPPRPFLDLLAAFRQDQTQTRYQTFAELLDYCRHSANPVGRLVLYLGRSHGEENTRLSDSICTGLQLANFWQDVARDYDRGRIYLPQEDLARFGWSEERFAARRADDEFRELLKFEVSRTAECLQAGQPLVKLVSPQLRVSVRLFIEGGLAILAAIRRQEYDVWSRRPVVSKWTKLGLLARAFLRRA